jgi:hypothetical protein
LRLFDEDGGSEDNLVVLEAPPLACSFFQLDDRFVVSMIHSLNVAEAEVSTDRDVDPVCCGERKMKDKEGEEGADG